MLWVLEHAKMKANEQGDCLLVTDRPVELES